MRRDDREEVEVATRICAHGYDVNPWLAFAIRPERVHVHAERHEQDPGRAASEPALERVGLAMGVRDDRLRSTERGGVEPPGRVAAELRQALRKPDGHVDEWWAEETRSLEEHERNPNRVDRREDDFRRVRHAQRRENRGEVSAVAAEAIEHRVDRPIRHTGPERRAPVLFEVVADTDATPRELVEPEQAVAVERLGRA